MTTSHGAWMGENLGRVHLAEGHLIDGQRGNKPPPHQVSLPPISAIFSLCLHGLTVGTIAIFSLCLQTENNERKKVQVPKY